MLRMDQGESVSTQFDFAAHERAAISAYRSVESFYANLASVIAEILEKCLKNRDIKVLSVQHRAKEPGKFGRKAATPSEADPNNPKYPEPLKEITDLAGVRIITFFPQTVTNINSLIVDEFEIVEQADKGQELIEKERFGYQSVHYLVRLKPDRARLAEYKNFATAITEVQVRTILQHAWAEIEHDIQYHSSIAIPVEIRRRFMVLAGMLELADREFQAIQNQDQDLATRASKMVLRGDLNGVEITPKALKLFLDKKLGGDDRISDWSYDWTTRLLKGFGFRDLKEVDTAIAPFDDGRLSSIAYGVRQGQVTRFELMLLAALGDRFLERHPWKNQSWFEPFRRGLLVTFKEKGIKTSTYDPLADSDGTAASVQNATPIPAAPSDASNTR